MTNIRVFCQHSEHFEESIKDLDCCPGTVGSDVVQNGIEISLCLRG